MPQDSAYPEGYLTEISWTESWQSQTGTQFGKPIPWMTYPAIEFFRRSELFGKKPRVFEFGSGSSTLFWAERAAHVYSVEDDERFWNSISEKAKGRENIQVDFVPRYSKLKPGYEAIVEKVAALLPPLVASYKTETLEKHGIIWEGWEAYCSRILNFPDQYFDVVVIDSKARSLSTALSIAKVKEEGIIVFDNSDRVEYNPLYKLLASQGFYRVDFWGPIPMRKYLSCTSIFSKSIEAISVTPTLTDGCRLE